MYSAISGMDSTRWPSQSITGTAQGIAAPPLSSNMASMASMAGPTGDGKRAASHPGPYGQPGQATAPALPLLASDPSWATPRRRERGPFAGGLGLVVAPAHGPERMRS